MPKQAKEWGALDVKRAKHSGRQSRNKLYAVGGVPGLNLQVTPNGAKSWLLRTTVGETRRAMGLGGYPEVSLAQARDAARNAKAQIRAGSDPIESKRAARKELIEAKRRNLTFSDAAEKWAQAKLLGKKPKSQKAIKATLLRYSFGRIGDLPVNDIETNDVLGVLEPIWFEKHSTATKLRGYIENILSWATVTGHREGENPARWRYNLKELLPSPSEVKRQKGGHFPAVPVSSMPAWWAELSLRQGVAAQALRFLTLCASRSGEVRGALWSEFDLESAVWLVPASRMKMNREHRVPLSDTAITILKSLPRMENVPYVFPNSQGKQLSDMAISGVMKRMQKEAEASDLPGWLDSRSGKAAVPHGLRSSFRDWAADNGKDRDLAKLALAHQVGSEIERSYRRTDMFNRRRTLMSDWAAYLHGK